MVIKKKKNHIQTCIKKKKKKIHDSNYSNYSKTNSKIIYFTCTHTKNTYSNYSNSVLFFSRNDRIFINYLKGPEEREREKKNVYKQVLSVLVRLTREKESEA
mgnify:CR=1 FL=1